MALATPEVTASAIREYELDFETGKLTGRIVTGVDAICVWAYLALKAKRYRWVIYSWYYRLSVFQSKSLYLDLDYPYWQKDYSVWYLHSLQKHRVL